jgi:prolyl-tRNA editing enzyme YbaK/EbsC (Cys-tRNA(Pro) deacylase)
MKLGKLTFVPVEEKLDLVAEATKDAIETNKLSGVLVTAIDPELADTAAFCEQYEIGVDISANCVIVEAKRADKVWYAACLVLATTRADINGLVRKQLDAKKLSFAPMEAAISLTKMEFGGIAPLGLPVDWPLLVDTVVANSEYVVIGSGIRGSKLLAPGKIFASLPNATVMDLVKNT